MKTFFKFLLVLILIAGILYVGNLIHPFFQNESKVISDTIARLKENVQELSTIKYYYTDVGSFENYNRVWNVTIPLTYKRFIVSYDGVITVGIKLKKMSVEVKDKVIEVHLPKAELLSHELDENSMRFFDQQSALFNPMKLTDFTEFVVVKKEETLKKIVTDELLAEAREEAIKVLKQLMIFSPEIAQNYQIQFVE